jgi:hypothetical protein
VATAIGGTDTDTDGATGPHRLSNRPNVGTSDADEPWSGGGSSSAHTPYTVGVLHAVIGNAAGGKVN